MGGLRICKYKSASSGFFIRRISVNVYTMEELCYYIYHNFPLIDDSLMNEELFSWMETELSQPRIAGILRQNVAAGASYRKLASVLLDLVSYCSKEELRRLFAQMDMSTTKPGSQMLKTVGDRMLENQKYVKAIREYNSILQLRGRDSQTDEFLGGVYHNMGVAFAQLFLYDQAARCFAAAFHKTADVRSREQYLAAVALGGAPVDTLESEEEPDVGEKLKKLVLEAAQDDTVKRLQTLRKLREEGDEEGYQKQLQEIMQEQKKLCEKYTSL